MSGLKRQLRADTIERAQRAYLARVSGASWAQAAEVAGFTDAANCHRAVRHVFEEVPAVDREEQRQIVRDRLDGLLRIAMKDAVERRHTTAVQAVARVIELQMKLDGLAEPDRLRVGYDPTQVEIDKFLDKFLPEQTEVEGDFFGDIEDEPSDPATT